MERAEVSPVKTSYVLYSTVLLSTSTPDVELPWGSISISSVFLPFQPRAAAILTQVVVLPTPPFWLNIATVFPIFSPPYIIILH